MFVASFLGLVLAAAEQEQDGHADHHRAHRGARHHRIDLRYVAAGAALAVGVTAALLIWRGRR